MNIGGLLGFIIIFITRYSLLVDLAPKNFVWPSFQFQFSFKILFGQDFNFSFNYS